MARKSKGKFTMPGIAGIKGFEGKALKDGRAASSAFQMKSPLKESSIQPTHDDYKRLAEEQNKKLKQMDAGEWVEVSSGNVVNPMDMFDNKLKDGIYLHTGKDGKITRHTLKNGQWQSNTGPSSVNEPPKLDAGNPKGTWRDAVAYQESTGGPSMNELVATRKTLEKGSKEWGDNQYKINTAYYGEDAAKRIQDEYNKKYNIPTTVQPLPVIETVPEPVDEDVVEPVEEKSLEQRVDEANIESTTSMYEDKMGDVMDKFDKKIQIANLQDRPRKANRLKNKQLRKLERLSDKAEVDVARTEKENIMSNWNDKIDDIKFEKKDYIQELKDGGASRQQIKQAKKDYNQMIKDAKKDKKWNKKEANKMIRENKRDARKSTTWTEDMI